VAAVTSTGDAPVPLLMQMASHPLPDPSAGTAGYREFRCVAAELDTRIGFLLPVLARAEEG
jgi:hypothetical protein